MSAARDVASACVTNSGPLLAHVSTQDTARDLDRVRAALGDQRLNFLGSSYGSYLGAVYVTLFLIVCGRPCSTAPSIPTSRLPMPS